MIVTNRNRRCKLCSGREVLTIEDEEVTETSLEQHQTEFVCKDKVECERNLNAETTVYHYCEDGVKVEHKGVIIFEAYKTDKNEARP